MGTGHRASGCLYGLAYGDALGKATEFMRYDEIVMRYGSAGPRQLDGDPALVTDDTQMTIAVADALLASAEEPPLTPDRLEPHLRQRFLHWWASPDNDRAPGMTCLNACAQLATGRRWQEATVVGSKGCGANMRVAPVGLVPGLTDEQRAGAAQLQAALTHGHPTGLAASELTAVAVHLLRTGSATAASLPAALREHCHEQRSTYHEAWLGDLWTVAGADDPQRFIARGWDECLTALDRLDAALALPDPGGDPCLATGAGWIAEEALATALYCFLRHSDDPVSALARGAASSGDSDSIASLAGGFAGAAYGLQVWPRGWVGRIEYGTELARLGAAWDEPT